MKVFIFAVLLMYSLMLPAMAEEQDSSESYFPTELAGYIVYEATDHDGEKIYLHKPVKYKLYTGNIHDDNDSEYAYRNYRMEHESKEAKEDKRNNTDSAANYPIYMDE